MDMDMDMDIADWQQQRLVERNATKELPAGLDRIAAKAKLRSANVAVDGIRVFYDREVSYSFKLLHHESNYCVCVLKSECYY
eukprot:jgi/Psemu1/316132/fgenesh1_kg.2830_\